MKIREYFITLLEKILYLTYTIIGKKQDSCLRIIMEIQEKDSGLFLLMDGLGLHSWQCVQKRSNDYYCSNPKHIQIHLCKLILLYKNKSYTDKIKYY